MELQNTHGAFSWVELQGNDETIGEARAFYQKVLGWEVMDMPMADGSTYAGIAVSGQPVGGFADKGGAGWLPYVTVDDVDARVAAARDAGAEVLAEPMDAPGVGRIAMLQDPFGARIAFIHYAQNGS